MVCYKKWNIECCHLLSITIYLFLGFFTTSSALSICLRNRFSQAPCLLCISHILLHIISTKWFQWWFFHAFDYLLFWHVSTRNYFFFILQRMNYSYRSFCFQNKDTRAELISRGEASRAINCSLNHKVLDKFYFLTLLQMLLFVSTILN